jgi:hypothetical protein
MIMLMIFGLIVLTVWLDYLAKNENLPSTLRGNFGAHSKHHQRDYYSVLFFVVITVCKSMC